MTASEGQAEKIAGTPGPAAWFSALLQWLYDYPGGARLSERFKSAFKVALAMVITYGISLGMDWDKAFWAALSVIFCSLATAGESINASVDRIAGTAVAAILALALVAFFPQDRWLFLMGLSAIIAVCSYRMTGGSMRKSVWFNAGFNLPIIAFLGETSGSLAPTTFDMAVLRVQQTALGAIVYSLVAVLVWPRRGDEDFVNSVRSIAQAQHQLFKGRIRRLFGEAADEALDEPLAKVAGQLPLLGSKLEGAAYDNVDVRLVAGSWARHIRNVKALHMAFERWHAGFAELEDLDLRRYIPDWERFIGEVEDYFQGVDRLLSGQPAPREPQLMALPLNEHTLRELSHFQRAAVMACRDQVLAIGRLAASLFDSASSVRSGEPAAEDEHSAPSPPAPVTIDLDRLSTTIRQTTALWLVSLAIIYVEAVPIVVATLALTNAFSMVFGWLPHVPATILYRPVIMGALFGGAFYIFIMPQLSGFWELGTFLFAAIFAVAYIFSEPRAALTRGMWMTMLVLIMQADNQQTFSFVAFANWFLVGILFVTFVTIAGHFPISFKPEDRLRAQFRRFWQSAAFLLTDLSVTPATDRLHRWRRAFHDHQFAALPPRLRLWSSALPHAVLEEEDRKRLDALLRSIELYSYRMQDLEQAYPEAMRLAHGSRMRSRGETVRAELAAFMQRLAEDPAAFDGNRCRETLERRESALEQGVVEVLGDARLTRDEGQRVYRLLGAYRALLDAFGDVVRNFADIDWQRLREPRF